jgi:hypothetical protein
MCITLACVQKYLSPVSNQVNIAYAHNTAHSRDEKLSFEAIWGSSNQLERNTSGGWQRFGTRILHTIESYQMAGEFFKS